MQYIEILLEDYKMNGNQENLIRLLDEMIRELRELQNNP